jgi:hypothetical protein
MSVTYYLTDHNGNQIAFFYRVDNERYSTCPNILWACRQYPQFQGSASSKGDFIEQAKQTLKEIKKLSVPVRKTCTECDISLQGRENESNVCDECNPLTEDL